MRSRDNGIFLSPEQRRSRLRSCNQTGMRFEKIDSLPNGAKQIWLCEILGISPRSTRQDNVDVAWVKVLEADLIGMQGHIPECPFELQLNKEEIEKITGVAITE